MDVWTDNPIGQQGEDCFGFSTYATPLADLIESTVRLPLCVGIYGPWGSGKTSLMNLVRHDLQVREQVKTVWFNPWKYEAKQDLWAALIRNVLLAMRDDHRAGIPKKVKEVALALLEKTAWMLLGNGMAYVSGGALRAEDLKSAIAKARQHEDEFNRYINEFEEDFQRAVNLYTGGGRLVVFVDDLDRCLPENAITIMESLKLFLGNTQCIFVLGMDPVLVRKGITHRYEGTIDIAGRDYLEKIVQLPFYLPPLGIEQLRDGFNKRSGGLSEEIWHLVESGLHGNPRKCKRFLNCLSLASRIMGRRDPRLRYYTAKLLILQAEHPAFYDHLAGDPGAWRVYEEQVLVADEETRKSALRAFAELLPFWEDLRLRAFMEQSCQTVQSSLPTAPDEMTAASIIRHLGLFSEQSQSSGVSSSGTRSMLPESSR